MAAGTGKLMPNLDQQRTKMLNLTVLQRIDPFVEEILLTAAHVTFYVFNLDLNQWSRKDVEGSLFVVKRNTQPRFQFIVMNRRNTDNLVEDLLGDFEYEVQIPYLLYRNAAQEVNGIWFYNQQECEEIANLFGRILNAYAKVPSKPKLSSSKSEFEELEAVPTLAVIEGPLEPSSSSKSTATDSPDDAFVNFFSTALNMGSNSSGAPLTSQHSFTPLPFSTHIPSSTPIIPTVPVASPLPYSSNAAMSPFENADSGNKNRATNLVKPSFFNPSPVVASAPASSTAPSAPPVNIALPLQRPYGSPLLQPFPPPAPSPSLTPASSHGPVINRDKVRDALVSLAQNNQFIDMVYREILNAHTQ